MSIFVDENTKVVYQGLTGSQGRFYGLLNRAYGTQVVAGTNPKKAGTDVDGIPIFGSVAEAVKETGATASCIFIPAPGVKDAVLEAAEGGVEFVVVHHRRRARAGRGVVLQQAQARLPAGAAARPELSRHHQPGQVQHRHHRRAHRASRSRAAAVGIVSRSGTLTYQALYELKQKGIGVTTCVGIGGDPVPGTTFIDCLERVRSRPRDEGRDDDRRDRRFGRGGSRRVHQGQDEQAGVAYIAGVTAPPGKKMGHAGAIVSGGKGTAAAKMEALRDAGAEVGNNPTEAGELMAEIVATL